MAPAPQSSEPKSTPGAVVPDGQRFMSSMLHLPANVYLLLFFTLGKDFQSLKALSPVHLAVAW